MRDRDRCDLRIRRFDAHRRHNVIAVRDHLRLGRERRLHGARRSGGQLQDRRAWIAACVVVMQPRQAQPRIQIDRRRTPVARLQVECRRDNHRRRGEPVGERQDLRHRRSCVDRHDRQVGRAARH
jgi:hypothetical protein